MEAAYSIAANKAEGTKLAVRETLLRLIDMRLAMPDVVAAPASWKQGLAGLFALPGSAEDSDASPLIDFHGPSVKDGKVMRGRSGTGFGLCAPELFGNPVNRVRAAPARFALDLSSLCLCEPAFLMA